MQSYAKPPENQLKSDLKATFQSSARESVWERISAYRDHGTYADEILRGLKWVLLPIACLFTLAFGVALHFNIFEPWVGYGLAAVAAILFTVFIEAAKIWAGWAACRVILFGMWKQGLSPLAVSVFIFTIFIGAFFWSYYNSTKGLEFVSRVASEWKIDRKTVDPVAATSDVQARIEETKATAAKGLGIQWKGTTTRSGQRIAEHSSLAMAEQEKQKTILLQNSATEQKRSDDIRNNYIDGAVGIFRLFGGKMEFAQLLILLGIVFCEKTLWHRMASRTQPQPVQPSPTPQPAQNYTNGHATYQNRSTHIGFNKDENGNVRSTRLPINGLPSEPVTQFSQSVTQTNVAKSTIGADPAFRSYMTRIRADLPNFQNKHAKNDTVGNRIVTVLQEAYQFQAALPSHEVWSEFMELVHQKTFSTMALHGQYDKIPQHVVKWVDHNYNHLVQRTT